MGHQNWSWKKKKQQHPPLEAEPEAVPVPSPKHQAQMEVAQKETMPKRSSPSSHDDVISAHVRVAEEAVAGWEKAQAEAKAVKLQLETLQVEKAALEAAADDLILQTESLREEKALLLASYEEIMQEKRTAQVELKALETKLETAEKESSRMRYELHLLRKEVELRSDDRHGSGKSNADSMHRSYLENLRKMAHLQAECHRLRGLLHHRGAKENPSNPHHRRRSTHCSSPPDTASQTSLSQSQSRLSMSLSASVVSLHDNKNAVENDEDEDNISCANSWASALLSEIHASDKNETFSDLSVLRRIEGLVRPVASRRALNSEKLSEALESASRAVSVAALLDFLGELACLLSALVENENHDEVLAAKASEKLKSAEKTIKELQDGRQSLELRLNESANQIEVLQGRLAGLMDELQTEKVQRSALQDELCRAKQNAAARNSEGAEEEEEEKEEITMKEVASEECKEEKQHLRRQQMKQATGGERVWRSNKEEDGESKIKHPLPQPQDYALRQLGAKESAVPTSSSPKKRAERAGKQRSGGRMKIFHRLFGCRE